jgi:hypothetical protein
MPPTEEPIREQILAEVAARYAALKANGVFWFTPGEVGRDWKNFDEVQAFPFYGVIEGQATPQEEASQEDELHGLDVTTVIWVRDDEARRTVLNRAIADVVRAAELDDTWDGLAVRTELLRIITDEAALVAKPFAYAEVTHRVDYYRPPGSV